MENTSTFEPNAGNSQTGQTLTDQAKEQMQDVTQQAKAAAGNLADQARTQVKSQLSNQKERAAESLGGVADALRQTGDQLNQREQPVPIGRYAEQAAQMVDQVAGYLRTKEIDEMVGQAENLARQRPAVFLGTAFAIGFMAARFLKSTTPTDFDQTTGGQGSPLTGSMSNAGRFTSQYYKDRETIREAEINEQQGYPLKSAYERAEELSDYRTTQPAHTGQIHSYGGVPDMSGDMNDEETISDFAEATHVRSSDV